MDFWFLRLRVTIPDSRFGPASLLVESHCSGGETKPRTCTQKKIAPQIIDPFFVLLYWCYVFFRILFSDPGESHTGNYAAGI